MQPSKRYHYDTHRQLETHLTDFIAAYNYARRLETLRGLTPYEFICKAWGEQPLRFTSNPHHQLPGPNTWPISQTEGRRPSRRGGRRS